MSSMMHLQELDVLHAQHAGQEGWQLQDRLPVSRPGLAHQLSVAGQHGAQRQADLVDGQRGRPAAVGAIIQDVQADVPVAVDVRVHLHECKGHGSCPKR